jgi:hypothetical protein
LHKEPVDFHPDDRLPGRDQWRHGLS